MRVLNLGILAHVDAGKTSLTERLLFETGAIRSMGSVDRGNTQTDSMEMEQQRGITIRSAVVSFAIDDLTVNLIDTPGHSDFISEVERALRVLDGAVLVVSAVEGVQAQTRVLMRTLTRLGVPTLIFVNKVDRMGARYDELLASLAEKLSTGCLPMSGVTDIGTRAATVHPLGDVETIASHAERLAENSDEFLAAYLEVGGVRAEHCRAELTRQTQKGRIHPVFFGSAVTGEGIGELLGGIRALLPSTDASGDGDLSAEVFKIERGAAGQKVAYVRVFSGTLHARETVPYFRKSRVDGHIEHAGRVTALHSFGHASTSDVSAQAGHIAKVWGLKDIQIGDCLGLPNQRNSQSFFPPPSLETVIKPNRPEESPKLHAALQALAELDPLINIRRDEFHNETSVCLYGEVQKEVIRGLLASDYGLDVDFQETQAIYVEKPAGVGHALEEMDKTIKNYFWATIGLQVEPGASGSGISFSYSTNLGSLPYAFHKAIEETVHKTLQQGLYGWEVTDIAVTLTHSGYGSPVSAAGDFRNLTPLVLMAALQQAGTALYEPVNQYELEIPMDALSRVMVELTRVRATPFEPAVRGMSYLLSGTMAASKVHEFEQQLPYLTHGEGTFVSTFSDYQQVTGEFPTRKRSDFNPLDRNGYLLHVLKRM